MEVLVDVMEVFVGSIMKFIIEKRVFDFILNLMCNLFVCVFLS